MIFFFVVNHQWQGGLQTVINSMRIILHIIQMPKTFGMVSGYTHVFSCRYSLKSRCHPWSNTFSLLLHFFCSVAVRNSTTFSLESRKHHFCSVYLGKDSKTGCCALPNWSAHCLGTNIIEYGEDNLSGKPISQQAIKGFVYFTTLRWMFTFL